RSRRKFADAAAGEKRARKTDSGRHGSHASRRAAGARPVLPAGPEFPRDRADSGRAHHARVADPGAGDRAAARLYRKALAERAGDFLMKIDNSNLSLGLNGTNGINGTSNDAAVSRARSFAKPGEDGTSLGGFSSLVALAMTGGGDRV